MKRRNLSLRKETLAELSTGELTDVVGGSHGCITYTKLVSGCQCTGLNMSLNDDCPTLACATLECTR